MADSTAIEWTDATWNPVTGCTKISAGCDHCYAERFAERFRDVKDHPFEQGFDLTLRPKRLSQPMAWRRPRMIFVNSMSDLFHKAVPRAFVDAVFETMENADWHVFQILTKRSSRLRAYVNARYADRPAPAHIWMGVSVEDGTKLSRVRHLRDTAARVRFLSLEPLSGRSSSLISMESIGPSWAARAAQERGQCIQTGSAKLGIIAWIAGSLFFFKQWGGRTPKAGGRLLDGREWNEWPDIPIAAIPDRPRRMAAVSGAAREPRHSIYDGRT